MPLEKKVLMLTVLATALLSASLSLAIAAGFVENLSHEYHHLYGWCEDGWCYDGIPKVYFELRSLAENVMFASAVTGLVGVGCLAVVGAVALKKTARNLWFLGSVFLAIHIIAGYIAYTVNLQKPEVWMLPLFTSIVALIAAVPNLTIAIKKKSVT